MHEDGGPERQASAIRIVGMRHHDATGGGGTGQHEHDGGSHHRWKIGRYRLGICITISDIAVAYAGPFW